jgi:4-amino-4-deoxy-L-arabinose transferase-like glycosyltransferase
VSLTEADGLAYKQIEVITMYDDVSPTAPDEPPRRRSAFIWLLLGAAILHFALALTLPRAVKYDESAYLLLGRNLVTGHGYTLGFADLPELQHPPLYPIVVGILSLPFKNLEQASGVASALFAVLMLIPCFVLAKRIYGERTAWLSAIYLALLPAFCVSVFYWGGMTETLFVFLFLAATASLLAGLDDKKPFLTGVAGILLALSYLTRAEGFFLFVAFFAYIGLRSAFHRAEAGMTFRHLAFYCAAFAVFAAPYIIYLHAYSGRWQISGKAGISWEIGEAAFKGDLAAIDTAVDRLDNSGEYRWATVAREPYNLIKEIAAHPLHVASKARWSGKELLNQLFKPPLFGWSLLPLIGLGLFGQPWSLRRLNSELLFLTTILVTLAAFSVVGEPEIRYLATLFPIGVIWLACGTVRMEDFVAGTMKSCWKGLDVQFSVRWIQWLVPCVVALSLVSLMRGAIWEGQQETPSAMQLKDVGFWLREHSPSDAAIVTPEAASALYAERQFVPSPRADWPEFLSYARRKKATYLVLTDGELVIRPHMAFLVREGSPEVELCYQTGEPGKRVYVFRLLPEKRLGNPGQ